MQASSLPRRLVALRDRLAADRAQSHKPTHAHLIDATAIVFELEPRDIVGPHRYRELVEARSALFWVARHRLCADYAETGRRIGGRDHSTVLHAVRRAEELKRRNPLFAAHLGEIEALVWPHGWKPVRALPAYHGPGTSPLRARDVMAQLARGVETAPSISAALGCNETVVRSALTRLTSQGFVTLRGQAPLPGTPGAYRRYRLADHAAEFV